MSVRQANDLNDHDDYYGLSEVVDMAERSRDDGWSIADAKAHLSELLETVGREGPQTISKRGRPVAVVVSFDEWERKKRRQGTLLEFFANAPEGADELIIERDRSSRMREIDL